MTASASTDRERALLARFADELIPPRPGYPAPSVIGVHEGGLDRLCKLVPAMAEAAASAVRRAADAGTERMAELRDSSPEDFRAISEAVVGVYLTEPEVMAAYGYQGRVPLDTGDPHARIEAYAPLVAPVVARGFVWRGDGSID